MVGKYGDVQIQIRWNLQNQIQKSSNPDLDLPAIGDRVKTSGKLVQWLFKTEEAGWCSFVVTVCTLPEG